MDSSRMNAQNRGMVYTSIAYWIWGYDPHTMPFGPPSRGLSDWIGMWFYNRAIRIQNKLDGTCPRCGRRALSDKGGADG